jgi:hypothetical protein
VGGHGGFCYLANDACRYASDSNIGWYVFEHNATGTDFGVLADFDVANDLAARRQEHTLSDFRMPIAAALAGTP